MQGQIKPGPRLPLGLVEVFFFFQIFGRGGASPFSLRRPFRKLVFYNITKVLVPVVQKLGSAIHWINRYPVDKY